LKLAKIPGGGDVFPSAAAYLAFKEGLDEEEDLEEEDDLEKRSRILRTTLGLAGIKNPFPSDWMRNSKLTQRHSIPNDSLDC
jgi:hypothetical protein